MEKIRKYGIKPYGIAVIHGGPGANGEMAPVARELAKQAGVLEPLQTALSVNGQVEELKKTLESQGDLPMTLVGFSWGAWLAFLLAAMHPVLVKKLVLVSSAPFKEHYAALTQTTRMQRFSEEEKAELNRLTGLLGDANTLDQQSLFRRVGELYARADAFDPLDEPLDEIDVQVEVYQRVWKEASEWRRRGTLLEWGKQILCPVVAIHGDYDPHPAEGVEKPLAAVVKHFRFILLPQCGHKPWIEQQAKNVFYRRLKQELV